MWVAAPGTGVPCPKVRRETGGGVKLGVRGPATPVMVRFVNAARPPASVAIGFTPDRAGPPVAMAAVTGVPLWLTGLPAPSSSCTAGWRARATPFRAVSDGAVTKAGRTPAPAASVMGPDPPGAGVGAGNVSP